MGGRGQLSGVVLDVSSQSPDEVTHHGGGLCRGCFAEVLALKTVLGAYLGQSRQPSELSGWLGSGGQFELSLTVSTKG